MLQRCYKMFLSQVLLEMVPPPGRLGRRRFSHQISLVRTYRCEDYLHALLMYVPYAFLLCLLRVVS